MSDIRYYESSYPPALLVPPSAPTAASLAPASIVVDTPTPVVVTGTNFRTDSRVWVDGVQQPTVFISATQVRYTALADSVGSQDVEVRTQGLASAPLVLTVTAAAGTQTTSTGSGCASAEQIAAWTVAEVQAYVTANPEHLAEVTQLELAGRARSTLLAWLDEQASGGYPEPAA